MLGDALGGATPLARDHDARVDRLLAVAHRALRPGGTIIARLDNPFGLRYLAGVRDDETGSFFAGIEGLRREAGSQWDLRTAAHAFELVAQHQD